MLKHSSVWCPDTWLYYTLYTVQYRPTTHGRARPRNPACCGLVGRISGWGRWRGTGSRPVALFVTLLAPPVACPGVCGAVCRDGCWSTVYYPVAAVEVASRRRAWKPWAGAAASAVCRPRDPPDGGSEAAVAPAGFPQSSVSSGWTACWQSSGSPWSAAAPWDLHVPQ